MGVEEERRRKHKRANKPYQLKSKQATEMNALKLSRLANFFIIQRNSCFCFAASKEEPEGRELLQQSQMITATEKGFLLKQWETISTSCDAGASSNLSCLVNTKKPKLLRGQEKRGLQVEVPLGSESRAPWHGITRFAAAVLQVL